MDWELSIVRRNLQRVLTSLDVDDPVTVKESLRRVLPVSCILKFTGRGRGVTSTWCFCIGPKSRGTPQTPSKTTNFELKRGDGLVRKKGREWVLNWSSREGLFVGHGVES